MIPLIPTIIASLALVVSFCLLLVHRKNQIERRHSELILERTSLLELNSTLRGRLTTSRTNAELLRLEIRKLPDCEGKFRIIEKMPPLIRSIQELIQVLEGKANLITKIDLAKKNRSNILIGLQTERDSLAQQTRNIENVEDEMLECLELVQDELDNNSL